MDAIIRIILKIIPVFKGQFSVTAPQVFLLHVPFFFFPRQCQKEHWTTHKKGCKRIPQHIGIPFIASIPASEATFQRLQSIAEEYAK